MKKLSHKVKLHVRRGDKVRVLAGNDKGKEGEILEVLPRRYRARVAGCRLLKRHIKPSARNPEGRIEEKEGTIHLSNLMLIDPASGQATRVGRRRNDKQKWQRIAKKTDQFIADVRT